MLAIAAAALILAAAGFAVAAATAGERSRDMALLAALGATRRQLTWLRCLEQAAARRARCRGRAGPRRGLARLVVPAVTLTATGGIRSRPSSCGSRCPGRLARPCSSRRARGHRRARARPPAGPRRADPGGGANMSHPGQPQAGLWRPAARLWRLAAGEPGPGPGLALAVIALLSAFVAMAGPREVMSLQNNALRQTLRQAGTFGISGADGWQLTGGADQPPVTADQIQTMTGVIASYVKPPLVAPAAQQWAGLTVRCGRDQRGAAAVIGLRPPDWRSSTAARSHATSGWSPGRSRAPPRPPGRRAAVRDRPAGRGDDRGGVPVPAPTRVPGRPGHHCRALPSPRQSC